MYGNYAFNLALSIRKYNKEIPIYLMYENTAISELTAKELTYFNGFIKAEKRCIVLRVLINISTLNCIYLT